MIAKSLDSQAVRAVPDDQPFMRITPVLGYGFSALLYFMAWWNPAVGPGERLIRWVAFERLCLAEFLTIHATTLLGATALAAQLDRNEEGFAKIFWVMVAFYVVLGGGAYFFHQDHRTLVGFYVVLVTRGSRFLWLQTLDADVMRAEVVKNFAMIVPLFILVGFISITDDLLNPWQNAFLRGESKGSPLLVVTGYYLLWALVEWKWPLRMAE
jgi:hypothetical protein